VSTGAEGCRTSCASLSVHSCGGASNAEGAACCQVQRGADIFEETVSFTYHKGWRASRINSLLFDNPVAYNNPSRDPAPGWTGTVNAPVRLGTTSAPGESEAARKRAPSPSLWARLTAWIRSVLRALGLVKGAIDARAAEGAECGPTHVCEALKAMPQDLEPALAPWQLVTLAPSIGTGLSGAALDAGFGEYDHKYFYSRIGENGVLMAAGKVGAAYLLDGVVDINTISKGTGLEKLLGRAGLDWITKGTCNPGDVRVHLETRDLPPSLTVVAEQRADGFLIPHTFPNGRVAFLARHGILSLEAFVDAESNDAARLASWLRALSLVLAMGAFYTKGVGADETATARGGPIFLYTLASALALVSGVCTVLWVPFYGPEDGVPPLLIAGGSYVASRRVFGAKKQKRL